MNTEYFEEQRRDMVAAVRAITDHMAQVGKTALDERVLRAMASVAARPRQIVNETGTDRIGDDRKHDGYGSGRLQQRRHGRTSCGQDDVRRKRYQFRRIFVNAVGISRAKAHLDLHVTARSPAQLLKRLQESCVAGLGVPVLQQPQYKSRRRVASARVAARPPQAATPLQVPLL